MLPSTVTAKQTDPLFCIYVTSSIGQPIEFQNTESSDQSEVSTVTGVFTQPAVFYSGQNRHNQRRGWSLCFVVMSQCLLIANASSALSSFFYI